MSISARTLIQRSVRSDQLRDLALGAVDAGFDGYMSGTGHLRLVSPSGQSVWMSTTSNGAARAYKNTRAALKRAGYSHKEHDMPKGQRLSPDQIDQIQALRRRGMLTGDIARRVGVSTKAVTAHTPADLRGRHGKVDVEVMGHTPSGQEYVHGTQAGKPATPEQIATIESMSTAGARNSEIAIATGLSTWTVSKYRVAARVNGVVTNIGPDQQEQAHELAQEHAQAVAASVAVADPPSTLETQTEESIVDYVHRVTTDFQTYPLITDLVRKKGRYQAMLVEAEKLGDEDLQLVLLGKVEMTGLEREIVAYWAQTHTEAQNGNHPKDDS